MNRKLIEECGKLLVAKELTLAFAESATAGRLAMEFSLSKDAGKFLKGGVVCYDACLKESILKVPKVLIDEFTPESAEVTYAIATGLMQLIPATIYIGVTGLVSDGGSETAEKPVGTMFICAVLGENKIFEDRQVFSGTPEQIILKSIDRTALLLKRYLISLGK